MSETPDGSVVTIKDLWQAQQTQTDKLSDGLQGVKQALERLTGHLESIDQRNARADQTLLDYEGRLRALERWRYTWPASILLGLGGAVTAVISALHTFRGLG